MSGSNVTDLLQQILSRLSIIEDKVGASGGSSASATDSQALPPRIAAFDAYCTANLNPFVDACNKLGGDAAASGNNLKEAWMEMRNYLLMACHCKEPSQADMMTLLKPVIAKMSATKTFENRNEWINHTKAISEGMSCLNWLCIKPAPREQVESTIGGSDYWANNIRKEYKNTNPDHIAFCNTFKTVLSELCVYIKEHHTTGVTWNPKGVDAKDYDGKSAGVGAAPAAAAPVAAVQKSAPTATVAKADLFAALNKDSAITSGLKKVTKDMQTWRSEYKGGDAPAAAPVAAAPKPAAAKKDVMKYPPKCDFDAASNKWQVEYQTAEQGVVSIEIKDKKETVYILGCVGATINITGKCKSIVVDSCKRTKVMFQSAMASCEVVNCQRVQIVCGENVAAVAIDKTDGIVVTLPRSSLNTEVVASKSSEMNLSWPDENGEMVEKPIPEQYVHRIQGMSVTANVSDLYTH